MSMTERQRSVIVALAAIWLSVLAASLFAPDLVSGSNHERFPIAAVFTWISGVVATRSVLRTLARGAGESMTVAFGAAVLWVAVALVAILVPPIVTGSDPTRLPLATLLAPIGGAIATGMLGEILPGAPRAAVDSGVTHCDQCGAPAAPDSRYCVQCGAQLKRAAG